MLVSEFIDAVLVYMDAEGSNRWTPQTITAIGGIESLNEWSDILDQNRFYKFAQRTVTTDSLGRIAITDLDSGSADTKQYFNRMLAGLTDGSRLYTETDFENVPMATQVSAQQCAPLYYLAGDYFQVLPVQSGLTLSAPVNWLPASISQLAGPTSAIIFPTGYEYILVWVTAATLLMKGASESQAAADLMSLADGARKNMLGSIARRTTRPTFAIFGDNASAWGGS